MSYPLLRLLLAFLMLAMGFTGDLRAQQDRGTSLNNPQRSQRGAVSNSGTSNVGSAGAWITGALVKVLADAAAGTAQSTQISAARNEFESFQVHVRAGTNPVQMSVIVSDFVNTQNNNIVISSATNVFVYREAYMNITKVSDLNGTLGMTPDPLIPTTDPYFNEPRNAFPITVPVNTVQSAWIDVLVPTTAQPGNYSATVTVMDGASVLATLTVTLKVWNFTLPSTATFKSAFSMSYKALCDKAYGGYNECAQYPGSGGNSEHAVELTHLSQAALFLDHRVTISAVVDYGPPIGDWSHFDSIYAGLLDGNAALLPTGAKPTLLSGAKLTSLTYFAFSTQASDIQDWVAHFTTKGWLGALVDYTCDEPPAGCTWVQANNRAKAFHAASPFMKTLVTTNIANASQLPVPGDDLLTNLNIIVPTINDLDPQDGSNQRSTYDAWLGGTDRHLWWYQACSTHGTCSSQGQPGPATSTWPSYMIDATPVRNRAFQWLAFLNRIEGELYYGTDLCWIGANCDTSDPWTTVYNYGGNGDGTLIYPGTTDNPNKNSHIGGTTPIPLPSVRLKHIRDGMEDFEYLIALSKAGDDAFARSAAATFITNAYTFNNDPEALMVAREALGDRLHQLNLPACSQAGICTHDFDGDGKSDIAWRKNDGNVATWLLNGSQISQSGAFGLVPSNWHIVGQRDFDGDGKYDWLWRDGDTGTVAIWLLNGLQVSQSGSLGVVAGNWGVVGTSDFNGDGKGDILWRDSTTNTVAIWLLNGLQVSQSGSLGIVPSNWSVAGTDGRGHVLWRDSTTGAVAIWVMNGLQVAQAVNLGAVSSNWGIVGAGDFNGVGKTCSDILWRDSTTGTVAIWLINNGQITQTASLGAVSSNWSVVLSGDFNGDGKTDILWRDSTTGAVAIWYMNGLQISSTATLGVVSSDWLVQGLNAD